MNRFFSQNPVYPNLFRLSEYLKNQSSNFRGFTVHRVFHVYALFVLHALTTVQVPCWQNGSS